MADYAFGSNPPYELMGIASLHPSYALRRRVFHGAPAGQVMACLTRSATGAMCGAYAER